jgi:hypothetical protein
MQPIIKVAGQARFKENTIVRVLLDEATERGFGLEQLAKRFDAWGPNAKFSQEDWEQFYQLLGYSVGAYGELSFVSEKSKNKADRVAEKMKSRRKKVGANR